MSCEHRGCNNYGEFRAHGSQWCNLHIDEITRLRKDIDNIKKSRKGVLELVNGKLVMVNRNDSALVEEFLYKFKSESCDEFTARAAKRVLGEVVEKLGSEVSYRRMEFKMRKTICNKHLHFYRKCISMYEMACIDESKAELVENVESVMKANFKREVKSDIISYENKRYNTKVQSIKESVYCMEVDI